MTQATPVPLAASGIGSLPGTRPRQAVRAVRDLLGEAWPYLPELPARGPGADLIGRTAAILVDLPTQVHPGGWRLTDRPGLDIQRANAFFREDLDELADAFDGWVGPLKIAVCGPWTLAAQLELPRGEKVLSDSGAVRELAQSMHAGLTGLLQRIHGYLPHAKLVLQLDEPSLPTVLQGRVASQSGFRLLPPVAPGAIHELLTELLRRPAEPWVDATVLHCCHPAADVQLLASVGADALALDVTVLPDAQWEALAGGIEAGMQLWAGLGAPANRTVDYPTTLVAAGSSPGELSQAFLARWRQLGLESNRLAQVVFTPPCGLASSTWEQAISAHRQLIELAKYVQENADA